MRVLFAALSVAGLILYLGQIVSVFDFRLAQRLGLQEGTDHADLIHSDLELWTARWDLMSMWVLPAAGILMLLDHFMWPYLAIIGGSVFVDAGGREAVKIRGLRSQGVRTGSRGQHGLMMGTYLFLVVAGLLSIVIGLMQVS